MTNEYRKEFFDRDYTVRESVGRIWHYMSKYKFRVILGLFFGLVNAGVLVPFYQLLQPTVAQAGGEITASAKVEQPREEASPKPQAHGKLDKALVRAAELPGWYRDLERFAGKFGVRFTDDEGNMQSGMLFLVTAVIPAILVFRLLLTFLFTYCLTWAASKAVADLRCDMLKHVEAQSMEFFGRVDMGQIIMRVNSDPGYLQIVMTTVLVQLVLAPFEILVSAGFIVHFAIQNHLVQTLLLLGLGAPLFFGPLIFIARRLRKYSKKMLEQGSLIGAKLHEILTCQKRVKAYHTEEFENVNFRLAYNLQLKNIKKALKLGMMTSPAVESIGILIIGVFVIWCFLFSVPLSAILPMIAPLLIIYKPIKEIGKLQVQVQETMAGISRVLSLLDVHMELPLSANPVRKDSFDREIVFDHVTFKYQTQDDPAVKDASLTIKKGQFVAVVGGTGSGKTTLSNLLARFYDPMSGSVSIDGVDVRDFEVASLRKLIGAVLQDTFIFNDTIANNIAYGIENVSMDDIVAAAKLAKAHDFIMSQPGGYGRMCGEKGNAISGGERQRIAIARAILKNPPILILDEATSALDTVTEALVQEAINNLMQNRTTLAIAHRLSTIRKADCILVMHQGRIVERGTHDELYAMGGRYTALCNRSTEQ